MKNALINSLLSLAASAALSGTVEIGFVNVEADRAVRVTGPQSNELASASAHLLRVDNPHQTSATQVGALTEQATHDAIDAAIESIPLPTGVPFWTSTNREYVATLEPDGQAYLWRVVFARWSCDNTNIVASGLSYPITYGASGDWQALVNPDDGYRVTYKEGVFPYWSASYIPSLSVTNFTLTDDGQTQSAEVIYSFAQTNFLTRFASTNDLASFLTVSRAAATYMPINGGAATNAELVNATLSGSLTLTGGLNILTNHTGVGYIFGARNQDTASGADAYQAWSSTTGTNDFLILAGNPPTDIYLQCRLFYSCTSDIGPTNPVAIKCGWGSIAMAPSSAALVTVATNQFWYYATSPSPNKYIDFILPPKSSPETVPPWLWVYAVKPYRQGAFATTGIRIRPASPAEIAAAGY